MSDIVPAGSIFLVPEKRWFLPFRARNSSNFVLDPTIRPKGLAMVIGGVKFKRNVNLPPIDMVLVLMGSIILMEFQCDAATWNRIE